jgi:iron(III) transport system substrate-binding protein
MVIFRNMLCAAAALLTLAALPSWARAAGIEDSLNRLGAEAAKVGDVIWYESSPDNQAAKIVAAFQKRFPHVKLDHVRDTGGNSIGGRIVEESRGGTRTADLATSGAAMLVPLMERNLLKKVDWQSLGASAKMAPNPYGIVTTSVIYVIIYNTNLIKPADAPKTWEDLLDPKWDGKIGIWVRGEGQGSLAAAWGEEKVADYIRKMNAHHPVLERSTFPLAQQVAAGEILVGFGLYHSAQPPLRRGAPIKIVVPDPAPISTLYSFIPAKAKNPAGGELLALWLATPEGAKAYEDATSRGNPLVETTKTYALLKGRTVAEFPVDQTKRQAAIVQRFNKMIESGETK